MPEPPCPGENSGITIQTESHRVRDETESVQIPMCATQRWTEFVIAMDRIFDEQKTGAPVFNRLKGARIEYLNEEINAESPFENRLTMPSCTLHVFDPSDI